MATWLCLHGFTGTPECFRPLRLPRGRDTFLTPVLTGHGSPPAAWETSFEAEVDRLARWLSEQQPPGPLYLLGYSLGARLGLGLLSSHPGRFEAAVLIGVNPGLRTAEERRERKQHDREQHQLLLEHGLTAFVDQWERLPLFATQGTLAAEVLAEQRRLRLTHTAEGLAHALVALGLGDMPDYWGGLPRLDLPIAIVVGAADAKFRQLGEAMLPLLPRARLALAPRAGHNVVLESPAWLRELMQRASEGA
ncbi:MAG TPA: alpha/beta fold hydrolase [Polyangiaceae bacterium]|nr:alpha/beta fold hydrolase [Polyangiaceae bacterium]